MVSPAPATMEAMTGAAGARLGSSALVAVAAHGLVTSHRFPPGPLDREHWGHLLAGVGRQRLSGLLVGALADGSLPATDEQRAEADRLHQHAMTQCVLLERVLLETVALLTANGVDHRVIKGPALAHTAYPDPAVRAFGDVDVVVPSASFDLAVEVLSAAGYRRQTPELRPGFDRRFGKGAALTTPGGLEVDLHRTLADGRFGLLVDVEELFASSSPLRIGGEVLRALGPEEQFLQVCFNAAIGTRERRLMPLRDVIQLATTTELDLDRLHLLCRRWRADAVLALAVNRAWEVLAVERGGALPSWAAAYRTSRRDAAALRLHTAADAAWGPAALVGVTAVQGAGAKLAYLHAVVLPDRRLSATHGAGTATRWMRRLGTLRRAVWPGAVPRDDRPPNGH